MIAKPKPLSLRGWHTGRKQLIKSPNRTANCIGGVGASDGKTREAFGAWSSSQENPLNRRAYNSAGTTSNKEVGQLLESLQPQVTNPLDRGAYNTTAAFSRHTRSSQAGQNSSGSSGSSGGAQSSANPSLERSAEWYQRETQRRFLLEDGELMSKHELTNSNHPIKITIRTYQGLVGKVDIWKTR